MNKEIENIIKKNLPEKKEVIKRTPEEKLLNACFGQDKIYTSEQVFGFNQAISQIDTKLIADEVLKVVVEKIKEIPTGNHKRADMRDDIIKMLSNLSPNKENK